MGVHFLNQLVPSCGRDQLRAHDKETFLLTVEVKFLDSHIGVKNPNHFFTQVGSIRLIFQKKAAGAKKKSSGLMILSGDDEGKVFLPIGDHVFVPLGFKSESGHLGGDVHRLFEGGLAHMKIEEAPPRWATSGVCAIHAVMLRAEKAMRDTLRETSLADIATTFEQKAPAAFGHSLTRWMDARADARMAKRRTRTREPPA